jgi:hypothetical protein
VSRRDKLIERIRNNPKDVSFSDACWLAQELGFQRKKRKSGSSHRVFSRTGEPVGLNFQKGTGGRIPTYQAEQLIAMIDKYEDEL